MSEKRKVIGIIPGDEVPDEYVTLKEIVRQLRVETANRGGRPPSCLRMLPRTWKRAYDELVAWREACGEDPIPLAAPVNEMNFLVRGVPVVMAAGPMSHVIRGGRA